MDIPEVVLEGLEARLLVPDDVGHDEVDGRVPVALVLAGLCARGVEDVPVAVEDLAELKGLYALLLQALLEQRVSPGVHEGPSPEPGDRGPELLHSLARELAHVHPERGVPGGGGEEVLRAAHPGREEQRAAEGLELIRPEVGGPRGLEAWLLRPPDRDAGLALGERTGRLDLTDSLDDADGAAGGDDLVAFPDIERIRLEVRR